MEYSRLWAFDGNNSLKRMALLAGQQVADTRTFDNSEYFLPQSYVNQFANDIPMRKPPPVFKDADDDEDINQEPVSNGPGGSDPTDGEDHNNVSECAKNWKAAASDEKKKMWSIFEKTRIFAAACRHSLILWVVDMVRSGEL